MPDTAILAQASPQQAAEHFDVLIAGAGISGVFGRVGSEAPAIAVRRAISSS